MTTKMTKDARFIITPISLGVMKEVMKRVMIG